MVASSLGYAHNGRFRKSGELGLNSDDCKEAQKCEEASDSNIFGSNIFGSNISGSNISEFKASC